MVLINEPYIRQGKLYILEDSNNRCICHKEIKSKIWAAIVVFTPDMDILSRTDLLDQHFAIASINMPGQIPIDIVSGYF